jgi:hypothetical protein
MVCNPALIVVGIKQIVWTRRSEFLWYAEQQGRQYGGWRRDGLKKEELRPAACLVYIGCSKSLHIHVYMPVLEFLII